MRAARRAVPLALAALLAGREAGAAFDKQELAVPGSILWVDDGDLDGDGRRDLVVAYRRGEGPDARKFIAVFFRGEAGWSPRPELMIAAPRNAAVVDLGDAMGDAGDELVYLAPDGVWAIPVAGRRAGRPTRVLTAPTLAGRPEEDDLPFWDFLRVPAPGQPPTLIVPGRGPLRLFRRDGALWKPWSQVEVDTPSFYDAERDAYRSSRRGGHTGRSFSFRATTVIPALAFVDQTGDGRMDLVTIWEDRLAVHVARADGTLTSSVAHRRWLAIRTPAELATHDTDLDVQVLDLDGDGVADASVTKIGGGLTNMFTETRIHRGLAGGGFSAEPSQVFKDDGFAALVRYVDVDGDGRLEMLHPRSEVSILGLSRVLLASKLELDVRLRRRDASEGRVFGLEPFQVLTSIHDLDFTVGGALRGPYPLTGGDVDGDGRPDVLVCAGGTTLRVHRGLDGGKLEDEGRLSLDAPTTRHTRLVHADPGRPPDVVMAYVARAGLEGRLVVFRPRGRGLAPSGAR